MGQRSLAICWFAAVPAVLCVLLPLLDMLLSDPVPSELGPVGGAFVIMTLCAGWFYTALLTSSFAFGLVGLSGGRRFYGRALYAASALCSLLIIAFGLLMIWVVQYVAERGWALVGVSDGRLLLLCGGTILLASTSCGAAVGRLFGRRIEGPVCLACGYDLTANESGRCPECGCWIEPKK